MNDTSKILFPFNGQFFTMDGFVKQVVNSIEAAKIYDTNTARPMNKANQKHVLLAIAERLKEHGK